MPTSSRKTRVLLLSVLCLFVVVGFAPGQARQQVADKNAQSASPPMASAPSCEGSKAVRGTAAAQPVSAEGER